MATEDSRISINAVWSDLPGGGDHAGPAVSPTKAANRLQRKVDQFCSQRLGWHAQSTELAEYPPKIKKYPCITCSEITDGPPR